MDSQDWKKLLIEQLREARKVTKARDPKQRVWSYDESPNYRVFETTPSNKLDRDKTYLISGTESQILLQGSLIKALHEILGQRLGYTIDFKTWFTDFQYEFKKNPLTGQNRGYVNESEEDIKYWGVSKDERPRFEWVLPKEDATELELQSFHELGYYVIKFWKNRKNKDEFIYITGTLTEIRQHCIDAMRVISTDSKGSVGFGGFVSNKGKPKVVLYFIEKMEDVEEGYQQIEARLSFRLNNLTEKWDTPNMTNLTLNDIEQLALRINTEFNTPTPYKIRKGKITVSYRDKANGLESYSYFYNKQDGIDFYKKMCTVAQVPFEAKFCKVTESQDEMGAYPTVPPTVKVLGEDVRAERVRPIGDVYFNYAVLSLNSLSKPIPICDKLIGSFNAKGFNIESYK
ncbi:MAG TPA: hypothetical protein V6D21_05890 [Candidatus Obscuribacterales bacterium]